MKYLNRMEISYSILRINRRKEIHNIPSLKNLKLNHLQDTILDMIQDDLDRKAENVSQVMKNQAPVWKERPNDNRNVNPGELRDSIHWESPSKTERIIGPDSSVKHTKYVVEGRKGGKRIAGHGKLLKWVDANGQTHYAKEVTQGAQEPNDFITKTYKIIGGK